MLRRRDLHQIARYLLVGGAAFGVEYTAFLLLIATVDVPIVISQTISFSLGLLTSFFGSRWFTFRSGNGDYHHSKRVQFLNYALLAFINLALTNVLIFMLVEWFNIPSWFAKLLTMVCVVCWNYIIFSRIIFKKTT